MFGIFLGLAIMIFLAYRGYSILWVAPVSAMIVAVFGGLSLLPAYTETYMGGLVAFVLSWFPMFMLGAIFGKIMEVTGSARSIAKKLASLIGADKAVLAVIISTGIMVYGGISLFVVVFAIYPISVTLFREANLPRRLIPGCIACGAFTFAMTAFPGSPQLNNIIPSQYFQTTAMAAPIIGIVCGILMLVLGYLWLNYRAKKMTANGEVFDEPSNLEHIDDADDPNPYLSLLPLAVVILVLNLLPNLVELHNPSTDAIIIALLCGIVLAVLLNVKKAPLCLDALSKGASSSMGATLNTAAAVGFGAVVKAVPGFAALTAIIFGINASPLISEALSVTLLAGATGSSSGGLGIALAALGEKFVEMSAQYGISLDVFHRVAAIASGGLDSLPHCGGIVTILVACEMNHKKSYLDMCVTTCIIPVATCVVAIILGTIGVR